MMNGKSLRAVCALLCCLMLASCGKAPAPAAPESSVPPAAPESVSVPTEEAPAVDEEFARVVEAAAPAAREITAEYGEVIAAVPEAERERLLTAVTALGVPAKLWDYGNSERGIEGWQAIAEFCEAFRRGEDAETAWYWVGAEEAAQYRMTAADGTLSREYRCWKFGDPSPSADSKKVETLSGVKFREDCLI